MVTSAVSVVSAVVALLTTINALRAGWEGRVIGFIVLLSVAETMVVGAWLTVTHGWGGDRLATAEWIGVLAAVVLINQFAYWFIKGELERDVKHERRELGLDRRELCLDRKAHAHDESVWISTKKAELEAARDAAATPARAQAKVAAWQEGRMSVEARWAVDLVKLYGAELAKLPGGQEAHDRLSAHGQEMFRACLSQYEKDNPKP